ncbi:MAG: endonuclease/exonuclease/phosphatase family protein [Leptolyngbya sp. SIO1E4]|nr:endonuclease/exonuclease/phosphatase family protein [Leptolyngbya sp. SIO1E4]
MATTLLSWWSFNNTNNDSDLLNSTGDDNARDNFGHLLDNNDPFDDGFYDPATSISGVTPQAPGEGRLYPVQDSFSGNPGALIFETDPGAGIPNISDFGAYIDVTDLTGDNFATGTGDNWGTFSGTGLNRPFGTFAGGSLSIVGSGNNGKFFDVEADLTGFENIDISWAQRGTSTGFNSREVSVSTDGGTNFTTIYTDAGALSSTWEVETADAGSLLDNAANAIIRFTVDGATSSGGNNRFDNLQLTASEASGTPNIFINEVDVDTPTNPVNDSLEFVELYDGGLGNTSLEGLTVVFFNGNGDAAYQAFDLDGFSTDADGFFVLGNAGVANVDLVFPVNTLQNGADAVAIYQADAADFPNGTSVTTTNLLDAVVYDTSDSDDSGLLTGLGQSTQFNENSNGNGANESNSRVPDGTGSFVAQAPTPGVTNELPTVIASIYEIQGAGHVSPFVLNGSTVADFFDNLPSNTFNITGDAVTTQGVVTAVDSDGFYIQDPDGDGNIATSDAIFVFTDADPGVTVGESVQVEATVAEFFPGRTRTRNLPSTQLIDPTVTTLSDSLGTVESTLIGNGGRVPPTENIDDDAFGSFDPVSDGIDFFESLEGMLVTAQDLVAVAPTNRFGEIFTVTDLDPNTPGIQGASGISDRGTLNISPDDFNPEKIQIDEDSGIFDFDFPEVNAGDVLGDVTGVVGYGFGNFEIYPTEDFTANIESAGLQPESTSLEGTADQLTVATYNVLNLDPLVEDVNNVDDNDPDDVDDDIGDGRFTAIAEQIVNNLNSPDIIGLQEVQDNTGAEINDGVTSASDTLQLLIDEIAAAGGPQYAFIDNTFITEGQSGGQPGGNIRTAYLYNPERVNLVDNSVQTIGSQASGEAFDGARLPLVATFEFNGEEVTVVNNHFSSKGGSAPILGIEQPFDERQEDVSVNGSLDERQAQSAAVQDFVSDALNADSDANVVVLGDLNEFEFISPVTGLESAGLTNLVNTLPEDERYSFIFQGNSQKLDHILVSDSLNATAEFDVVHANSEFAETASRASDHDPAVARFTFEPAANVINGTDGNDNLNGTGAAEVFNGFDGNDTINGNGGEDTYFAGAGNDNVNGSNAAEYIDGGSGNDTINGNGGEDEIFGREGNDRINGSGASEFIDGGAGNDEINGNGGNDTLIGGDGDDIIRTGSGNDLIDSGSGNDQIQLNGGSDTVVLATGEGFDRIENFQLGNTQFDISVGVGDLTFQRVNNGVEISINDDLLAFVNNTQVSTFENNLNNIFV